MEGAPICIPNPYDLDSQITDRYWVNHIQSSIDFSNRFGGFTTAQIAETQGVRTHDYLSVQPTDDCWLTAVTSDGIAPFNCLFSADNSVEIPYQSCRGPGSSIETPSYVTYQTWYKCYSGVCANLISTQSSYQTRASVAAAATVSDSPNPPSPPPHSGYYGRDRKLQTTSETTHSTINVRVFLRPSRAAFEALYTGGELVIRSDGGTGTSALTTVATLQADGTGLCGAPSGSGRTIDGTNPMYTGQFGCMASTSNSFNAVLNSMPVPSVTRWDLAYSRSANDIVSLGSPTHEQSIAITSRGETVDLYLYFDASFSPSLTVAYLTHSVAAAPPPPPLSYEVLSTVASASHLCTSSNTQTDVTAAFQHMLTLALAAGQDPSQCMGSIFGGDGSLPYLNVWDVFFPDPCPLELKTLSFTMAEAPRCVSATVNWYGCIDLSCIVIGSPPALPPQPLPPGVGVDSFTIWVSDTPYIKGDRAASIPTGTDRRRNIVPIGADANGKTFVGRYWTLQSYALHEKLRIDGFRIWGIAPSPPSPPPSSPPPPLTPPSPPPPPPLNPGGFIVYAETTNRAYTVTPYLNADGEYIWPISASGTSVGITLPHCDFSYSGATTQIEACTVNNCARQCAKHAETYTPGCGEFEHIRSTSFGKQVCYYYIAGSTVWNPGFDTIYSEADGTPWQYYTLEAVQARRLEEQDDTPLPEKKPLPEQPKQSKQPKQEQQHQPMSASDEDPSAFHWWNRLETHNGRLYPYRNMPGLDTATAAASLATALSLSNASDAGQPNAHLGQNATLVRPCERVNCTEGGRTAWSAWIYEQPDVNLEKFWARDDLVHMSWLVSHLVEPAVHIIYSQALYCTSPELCGSMCDACPPEMRSEVPVEGLLRQVEAALGESNLAQRDPIECVQSPVCLEDVAHSVARANGATEAAPAPFDIVAAANAELATGFLERTTWNEEGEPFNTTLWRRHELAKAHRRDLQACCSRPAEWHVAAGAGRRLREEPDEKNNPRPEERLVSHPVAKMYRLTAEVCHQLNQSNVSGAASALYEAIQQWALLGGEGNSRTNPNEQFCSDCDHVNHTQSCHSYFSLVSARVNKLRLRQTMTGDEAKARRRKLIEKHVSKKAEGLCCAKFDEDGREECAPKYCAYVMRDVAAKRIAMVGQHAHRTNHSVGRRMTVDALTGIDYINPDHHIDQDCRPGNKSLLGLSEAECFGRR